ncbi:MAG: AzlC family ABC transporter permease [Acidimicrobiales bacterium]
MSSSTARTELIAGAKAVAPMLVGVIPFGLVAGATPATTGLGGGTSIGLSTIVFAGASQLAATDVLAHGGSALVAVIAACTINLRMLLYSASLAPHLSHVPLRRRLFMAYLLTDQAYAVSITRWTGEAVRAGEGGPAPELDRRVPYYLGAGLLLWANWQVCTIVGVLIGSAVPDSLPLDFAVPLVFLVLLVPAITSRPAAVAALSGGGAAVLSAELGAGHLAVLFGAVTGIAAGALAEVAVERRGARDDTPLPPQPGLAP